MSFTIRKSGVPWLETVAVFVGMCWLTLWGLFASRRRGLPIG